MLVKNVRMRPSRAAQVRRDQPGEDRVLGKGVGQYLAEQGCLVAAGGADGLRASAGGYRFLGHRTPPSASSACTRARARSPSLPAYHNGPTQPKTSLARPK